MKKLAVTVSALAMALALGSAIAEEAAGKIAKVSKTWFSLADGSKFSLAKGVSMEGLKPGAQVTVSYEMKDGKKVATQISPSK